jgi:hypothetical protein
MPTPRRRGRWTYVSDPTNGPRWRLDGTTLDLEYDPLDAGSALRGAWIVWLGSRCTFTGIDHFLDGSMEHVEGAVDDPGSFSGAEEWARVAREQIDGERCESQGCHCTPSLPCDTACDGRQHFDGSTVSCTMCARELAEMIEEG